MKTEMSSAPAQPCHVSAKTEIRRNVLETFCTRVLIVSVTFAIAMVIARVLGPTGRGLYAVAVTLGAIGIQLGNCGLNSSNVYFAAKDRSLLPALIGNTLSVVLLSCVLAAICAVGFLLWPEISPVQGTLLVLALASIPAGLGYLLTQGLLLGVNEVRAYNLIECASKAFVLILFCIFTLAVGGSPELFLGITLTSVVISSVWALRVLKRISGGPLCLSWEVFRQSFGVGIKAYLILLFGFLVLRIDLLLVKYMLGATEAGYYSISQVLAENMMMFPVVVGMILFPKLSAIQETGEKFRLAKEATLVTVGLMLPTVIVGILAAGPVIEIAFGRDFLPAVSPFIWLMPGTYFLAIETVMVQLLNSEGFPRIIVVAWIADALLNVALNFWAIPRYGITGASVVSSICYFLMFVVVSVAVWRSRSAHQAASLAEPQLRTS